MDMSIPRIKPSLSDVPSIYGTFISGSSGKTVLLVMEVSATSDSVSLVLLTVTETAGADVPTVVTAVLLSVGDEQAENIIITVTRTAVKGNANAGLLI